MWTAASCGDASELGCADACVGQQLGGPRRRRYPGTRTIFSVLVLRTEAVSERCRRRPSPRRTPPSLAQFSQIRAANRCCYAVRAERGRCDGPAAAQPAHGTVSAAVLPGQLLHGSQRCPETGAEAGVGRRGGATTAAEANHQKKTTTMRTRASPARRCSWASGCRAACNASAATARST